MSDLIDRQAVIDTLTELRNKTVASESFRLGIYYSMEEIKKVPPAQPERKTGRWILSDDREWKTCSECGADVDVSMGIGVYVDNDEVSEMCFCPNCGAKMEVEHE